MKEKLDICAAASPGCCWTCRRLLLILYVGQVDEPAQLSNGTVAAQFKQGLLLLHPSWPHLHKSKLEAISKDFSGNYNLLVLLELQNKNILVFSAPCNF